MVGSGVEPEREKLGGGGGGAERERGAMIKHSVDLHSKLKNHGFIITLLWPWKQIQVQSQNKTVIMFDAGYPYAVSKSFIYPPPPPPVLKPV